MIVIDDDEIDEAAVVKHCKLLKKEGKLNPNQHIIAELMRKTFKARIRFIQTIDTATGQPQALNSILELYPSIRRYYQVYLQSGCTYPVIHAY